MTGAVFIVRHFLGFHDFTYIDLIRLCENLGAGADTAHLTTAQQKCDCPRGWKRYQKLRGTQRSNSGHAGD
jgi:hypothetical protein